MKGSIKRLVEWKWAPFDTTELAFNYLLKCYIHEIMSSNVWTYRSRQIHKGTTANNIDLIFQSVIRHHEK